MSDSSRPLFSGAILLLVLGCGESRAPTRASGAQGGSGGAAAEPSLGGNGGSPDAGAGGDSAMAGTSGAAGAPQGGAAAQAGAPADAGEASAGGVAGGGAAGRPGDDPIEPVTVIRGDPTASFTDLRLRGVALENHEGQLVTVRIGRPDRPPERLASGQARIREGAFELFFPGVWEDGLYKDKLVHIDVDGDGTCTAARDRLFHDARGVNAPELTVRGSGDRAQHDIAEAQSQSEAESLCTDVNARWPAE